MGQMKWLYHHWTVDKTDSRASKERELSFCDSPGEKTLFFKETQERDLRKEGIM